MRLVVLGSSLTALAVVRNAKSNNLDPVLIDTKRDIASLSSQCSQFVQVEKTNQAKLAAILSHSGKDDYLIATSDAWLNFIIRYREKLQGAFRTIFCPSNETLEICLDKKRFAHWCEENDLPAPRIIKYGNAESLREDIDNVNAYFVRPIHSAALYNDVPKSLVVTSVDELQRQVNFLRQKDVDFIITESLLGQDLLQYSIPFVRSERGIRIYVARKVRPMAQMCAVGTYVSLEENPVIEAMGKKVAQKLDFYGIGEIEILYSRTTQQSYIIEVNARPWIQYPLAIASGYNFIGYLIDPDNYPDKAEKKLGKSWINFGDDLYVCFSRSEGHITHGKLSIAQYFSSLFRVNVFSTFALTDLRPFLNNVKATLQLIFSKK